MNKIDIAKSFGRNLAAREKNTPLDFDAISAAIYSLNDALMAGVREPEYRSENIRYKKQKREITNAARDAFNEYATAKGNDDIATRYSKKWEALEALAKNEQLQLEGES